MFLTSVVLFAYFAIADVDALYGNNCTENSYDCDIITEDCLNGVCKCRKFSHLSYDYGIAKCSNTNTMKTNYLVDNICPDGCDAQQRCERGACVCQNDSHVLAHHKCYEAIIQNPLARCSISNSAAYICNASQHQYCSNSTCVCFRDYYLERTTRLCEAKAKYMKFHKIDSYKAMPQDYCVSDVDCVDGLVCRTNTCNCPDPCSYKSGEYVCDCGNVNFETPSNVVLTGVILGTLSIMFWTCCIRSTIRKFKNRNSVLRDETRSEADEQPLNRASIRPSRQPGDKPPSYDEVIGTHPSFPAPMGFDIGGEKPPLDNNLAYPLKPVVTDVNDPGNLYPEPGSNYASGLLPYPDATANSWQLPYPLHPFQPSAPLPPRQQPPPTNPYYNEGT